MQDVASSTRSEAQADRLHGEMRKCRSLQTSEQAGMDDLKTQLSVLRSDFMEAPVIQIFLRLIGTPRSWRLPGPHASESVDGRHAGRGRKLSQLAAS